MATKLVSYCAFRPPPPSYTFDQQSMIESNGTYIVHLRPGFAKEPDTECKVVFVYCHGNAEDLGMVVPTLQTYATNIPAEVVGFDYTGYGPDQTEEPSEEACYENLEDVLDYLKAVGTETKDIVLIGRSLGSGPTCHVASQYPFAGVILESPFLSPILTKLPFTIPFFDIFHNASKVSKFACPLMIIHGDRDRVVPYRNGVKLYHTVSEDKRHKFITVEGAGHNDLFLNIADLNAYLQDIREFAQKICTLIE